MTRLMSGPSGGEREAEKEVELASGGCDNVEEATGEIKVEVEEVDSNRGNDNVDVGAAMVVGKVDMLVWSERT